MKRYETLAHTIADDIRNGNLAVGTRLPSLRQIIAQHGVSQSTVFRAYYLLEQWGLIRARERSGYYVAPGAQPAASPATISTRVPKSRPICTVFSAVRPFAPTVATCTPFGRNSSALTGSSSAGAALGTTRCACAYAPG
ncbi:winged helix-turn-helix domain-containing protein, partial [Bacillus subtilis]|nr:winged helix-turn-helix domain-containing protein [Bacillus subtilis]